MKWSLIIFGLMMMLGPDFWLQSKFFWFMRDTAPSEAMTCIVSAGMHNCPKLLFDNFQLEIYTGFLLFYAGLLGFAYGLFKTK